MKPGKSLKQRKEKANKFYNEDVATEIHKLFYKGQGVVSVKKCPNSEVEEVVLSFFDTMNKTDKGIQLKITKDVKTTKLSKCDSFKDGNYNWQVIEGKNINIKKGATIDKDSSCDYWFSIDSKNRYLRYGKGEIRKGCTLLEFYFPKPTEEEEKEKPDEFAWIKDVKRVKSNHSTNSVVYRDAVVNEIPLFVVPIDRIKIDDVARGTKISSGSLTKENQLLFDTVAGPMFELNSEDFPYFTQAIEESINNKWGWCYNKLQEKANEFGGNNIDETYLRITLGLNGGESPGVPYVVEIWPPGHYSPVHNHGNSNAVIKVLHGEITVNMFRMLSEHHLDPFSVAKFSKGDVTYITPELNQVHQLRNTNVIGPTCITIQCYLYSNSDNIHYEYFDYLDDKGNIQHFDPNSDMDYLDFKNQMKKEWIENHNY